MFSVILPFFWTSGVVLNFQGGIWVGFWKNINEHDHIDVGMLYNYFRSFF